jgi:hypothetical protein
LERVKKQLKRFYLIMITIMIPISQKQKTKVEISCKR